MTRCQLHIGFDESQKERGKLGTNYQALRQFLQAEGYGCWEFSSFPITRQSLQNYDIMVFACTDSSKFTPDEIEAIAGWVREDGGGLLLLSHAGGDRGRRSNMGELASQFAMVFENDQVLDEHNNFGIDNMPNITYFPMPHPIIEGINSICYRAGCSVSIVGFAQSVAIADATANPSNATVIGASDQGEGRVVCIGSYEILRDEISGGINHPNHVQLARNVFEFLQTPKRMQLREGGIASQPGNPDEPGKPFDPYGVMDPKPATTGVVEIRSVHDLRVEMHNIVKELDVLRARVSNVYSVIAALDGGGTEQDKQAAPARASPEATTAIDEPSPPPTPAASQDELLALIKQAAPKRDEPPSFSTPPPQPPSSGGSLTSFLSELKSEQAQMSNGGRSIDLEGLEIKQPGLGSVLTEDEGMPVATKVKPYVPTADDKRKTAAELEEEIDKLEAKLKSVENLKGFIERKFKDGKISEAEYERDHGRYQSDIDATRQKVEAYKALLDRK